MDAPFVPEAALGAPQRLSWTLLPQSRVLRSPYTNKTQTLEMPGHRWHVSVAYQDQSYYGALHLQQFISDMAQAGGRFQSFHLARSTPAKAPATRGTASGWGSLVSVQGLRDLQPGDMIKIGSELKMVLSQTGEHVFVAPPLRQAVTDVLADTVKPATTFYCTTPEPRVAYSHGNLATLTFDGIEVLT